jgi:RHS repeat-associated protein
MTALDGAGQVGAQADIDRNEVGTIDAVRLVSEVDGPDADAEPDAVSRTDYEYTADHELQTVVPPGRSSGDPTGLVKFTWDAASRLRSRTDGEGRTQTYDYDDMDRLIRVTYDSGAFVSFGYDANGNRTMLTDTRGTTTWTYDLLNRPTQEERGGLVVHAYSWDLAGNLRTHTEAGETTSYDYDKRNFPASVTDPDGKLIDLEYGRNDRLLQRVRIEPSGQEESVDIEYKYEDEGDDDGNNGDDDGGSGRILELSAAGPDGTVFERYRYGYTDDQSTPLAGNRTLREFVEDHALDRCTDYDYDWLGRLVEARMTNDASDCDFDRDGSAGQLHRWQYEYDAASNLIESTHNGDTTTYRVNARHELCWTAPGSSSNDCGNAPAGADSYDYDQAGNVLEAADRYELAYNERGQTELITPNGAGASQQQYAEIGQSQRIGSGNASFLYSLMGLHRADQPTPGAGDPLAQGQTRYVRAPDGSLLSQRKPDGSTEYFLFDAHPGSVVALIDTSRIDTAQNPVTARYRYDPYGNVIDKSGGSDTPWRFAGAYFDRFPDADPGSQTGLYKMGQRYYDPRAGRWTQKDPLDQFSDLREGNGCMYSGADPVNLLDPTGTTGTYWNYSFKALAVGWSYETTRNYTGGDTSEHQSVGIGYGVGGGLSAGEYTGEVDPGHDLTLGGEACVVICVGFNTDYGLKFGIGPKVGAGVDANFSL